MGRPVSSRCRVGLQTASCHHHTHICGTIRTSLVLGSPSLRTVGTGRYTIIERRDRGEQANEVASQRALEDSKSVRCKQQTRAALSILSSLNPFSHSLAERGTTARANILLPLASQSTAAVHSSQPSALHTAPRRNPLPASYSHNSPSASHRDCDRDRDRDRVQVPRKSFPLLRSADWRSGPRHFLGPPHLCVVIRLFFHPFWLLSAVRSVPPTLAKPPFLVRARHPRARALRHAG